MKVWTLDMVEALETMEVATSTVRATSKTRSSDIEIMSLEQEMINDDLMITDEEILARHRVRFAVLEDMTRAIKGGKFKAMIVTGSPGVGKSHGVEKVLGLHDMMADIGGDEKLKKYDIVKGNMTALGLYCKLHEFRNSKNILVFDDCDEILMDDLSLNILKAALDSKAKRNIHWNSDSRKLKDEGIPNSFEFEGGAIFITNINFDHVRSKKLQGHLKALESRCHYLDLTINTTREKILRIQQVVEDGALDAYDLNTHEQQEIIDFVKDNKHNFRELSVRMVLKVADLKASFKTTWQEVARITCMKNA